MRGLSIARLNEHLEGTETDIRRFSEELVQQLALRDELDFEKEVKNTFIAALIDVQNRQKEQRELMKRKRKERNPRGGAGTPRGGAEKSPASVSGRCFSEGTAGAPVSHVSSPSLLLSASAWRRSPRPFRAASGTPLGAAAANAR